MDYSKILASLKAASLFDLYRLDVAINNELENPSRIMRVKQKLRLGMKVSFFCDHENRLILVTLLELKQKNVVVRDEIAQKCYRLPYYMLNIDQANTTITPSQPTQLTMNHLNIGEHVGFNKDGMEFTGIIKRLNQKTVTLDTEDGRTWRVAYTYLFRVTDGDFHEKDRMRIIDIKPEKY